MDYMDPDVCCPKTLKFNHSLTHLSQSRLWGQPGEWNRLLKMHVVDLSCWFSVIFFFFSRFSTPTLLRNSHRTGGQSRWGTSTTSTVETLYSTIYYSKYFIELNFDKFTQYVALWTHKRHPIPRPFGRAMECLSWVFHWNWPCYKGFLLYMP